MNFTVSDIGGGAHAVFEILRLDSIILQLTSEYYKNIKFRERSPARPGLAVGSRNPLDDEQAVILGAIHR